MCIKLYLLEKISISIKKIKLKFKTLHIIYYCNKKIQYYNK